MTPYETIEMLQERAYSTKYSSSIFLFYEDFRGYNFCNVEQLIAEGRRNPIKYTYNPGAQIDDQKNVAGQMTITEIAFPQGKNVLDKIKLLPNALSFTVYLPSSLAITPPISSIVTFSIIYHS